MNKIIVALHFLPSGLVERASTRGHMREGHMREERMREGHMREGRMRERHMRERHMREGAIYSTPEELENGDFILKTH